MMIAVQMRLTIILSVFLHLVESNNLTVLLVGSKYKLTEQRVIEKRKMILADCQEEKLVCSVVDALNDFSTENDPQGMWTMVPAILKLPVVSDWIIIAEDTSELNIKPLKHFIKNKSHADPIFIGFGLQDREPTIIHHFGMNTPDGFRYPMLSAGFILSRNIIEAVRKVDRNERWSGFAIDAKYEFALLVHKWSNIIMEHSPESFCCGEHFDTCIVSCALPAPSISTETILSDSEIHVMIKTFEGHHKTRLSVLKNTWTSNIPRIEYCSDVENLEIPTVNLGVGNTERGHCVKTWAIFRRFLDVSGEGAKWLVIADDDTLMSWKRLKKMLEIYDPRDNIIIGERYGFGFIMSGESGYDYPTGGSGMIFSRSAVESILKTCPTCAADTDPDDMTIGICAVTSGVPIIHEQRLHQARPQDYAPEYLQEPISFHKFTDVDPIQVYYRYLVEFEELDKQENDYTRTEL
ncbi:hypothetical protein CAEBREN_29972 [Caenorhabditis brenneri]|uniref:N-acetylgalactosaminide beta-1,3-galactosyltransferase n=1 Tax=Caenorhabditis brenneri TaxID=135651 RepID=G0PH97_CAEBE|nr:hypothetical protein CAEBREN_29972 [Caenorhabditis brenneri]